MTAVARIERLMMVDDQEFDRLLQRRVIDRSGLVDTLIQYDSAEAALDHLRHTGWVDGILLDIRMPGLSGLEFLALAEAEFGESFDEIVVMMLSSSRNPCDLDEATRHAAVRGFRAKPLDEEALWEMAAHVAAI